MFSLLLLNLLLVSFAMAEETVSASNHGNLWAYGTSGGVLGFIVLILDIMVFSKLSHFSARSPACQYPPSPIQISSVCFLFSQVMLPRMIST
jgi:hypothetical protein